MFHVKHLFEEHKMSEKRLGRGLDFLIPSSLEKQLDSVSQIQIKQIKKNRFQPREFFNEDKHKELALSIKENGVIQPILVRQEGGQFELIAGERRLRACSSLGQETIPAIVLNISDAQLLEFALVENIQREDLNPMEEARAFQMFVQFQGLTHEDIANRIGKHRTYVTNSLRLLDLPSKIQEYVSRGTFSTGHARALLGLSTEKEMFFACEAILNNALTVRKTEELVKSLLAKKGPPPPQHKAIVRPPHILSLEKKLREHFNTRVEIQVKGNNKGRVSFSFHSEKDLGRLFDLLVSGDGLSEFSSDSF